MNLFPPLCNLRKYFVMAATDNVLLTQFVIFKPAAACQDVAHLPVKHGYRRRRMFDKQADLVFTLLELFFGPFALRNVQHHAHPPPAAAMWVIDVPAPCRDPSLPAVE